MVKRKQTTPAPAVVADEPVAAVVADGPVAAVATPGEVLRVAEGRAITSLRGVLCAGEVVSARDLPGGDEALAVLYVRGIVQ